jgi:hypothetical protein
MNFRTDTVHLDSIEKTPEGFLTSNARVTRSGIFKYFNTDGSERLELRHDSEVFKGESVDTLKRKPLCNNHPSSQIVTPDNAKSLTVGFTGDSARRDSQFLVIPITITDKAAIADVEAGKRELSCGYYCDVVKEDGMFNGEKYTHKQTNIRYNHVAIVHKGRAGTDVRIDGEDNMIINDDNFDPLEAIRFRNQQQSHTDRNDSSVSNNRTNDNFDPTEYVRFRKQNQ